MPPRFIIEPASRWLETTLSEPEPVGLAWVAVLAFLRVGTNPRIRKDALTVEEAADIVATVGSNVPWSPW